MFTLMKWAKPKMSQEPPPLKTSTGEWISDPSKRAEYLQEILLARFNAEQDLTHWEADQRESIPWNTTLTIEEVIKYTMVLATTPQVRIGSPFVYSKHVGVQLGT